MISVTDVRKIYLGVQGENEEQTITIDVKPWLVAYPNAEISIWHKRNGDSVPTQTGAIFDDDEGIITWTPTYTDTYVAGEGEAEIRLYDNGIIKKTRTVITGVSPSVTGAAGETLTSGWQGYINYISSKVADAIAAKIAAEAAAAITEHPPRVNEEAGVWQIWDPTDGEYVDTDILCRGKDFDIAKRYASIAAMEADFSGTDVRTGEYVIISTTPGDTDNGKVYKKGTSAWEFILQMAGVKGDTGDTGATGNGIASVVMNDDYTLTITLTNGDEYTTESIRGATGATGATGQTGQTGATGNGIASAVLNNDYTLTITFTNGDEYTTGSIRGPQGETGQTGPTGAGVPTGGTTGQIIRKTGAGDLDVEWSDEQDITGKADKVDSPATGNFAGLDENGNLTDSGYSSDDFLTEHQDISGKADLANIAPAYDNMGTYSLGELVTYEGQVYRCTTAINTSEDWNSGHWTATGMDTELGIRDTSISTLNKEVYTINVTATGSVDGNINACITGVKNHMVANSLTRGIYQVIIGSTNAASITVQRWAGGNRITGIITYAYDTVYSFRINENDNTISKEQIALNNKISAIGSYDSTTEDSVSVEHQTAIKLEEFQPTKGYWLIIGNVTFASNTNGTRTVSLSLNNNLDAAWWQSVFAASYGSSSLQVVRYQSFNGSDSIKLVCRQTSGSSLSVTHRIFAIKLHD